MTAALISQMWKLRSERSDLLKVAQPENVVCSSEEPCLSGVQDPHRPQVASSGPQFPDGPMCTAQRWLFELLLVCTAPWGSYHTVVPYSYLSTGPIGFHLKLFYQDSVF